MKRKPRRTRLRRKPWILRYHRNGTEHVLQIRTLEGLQTYDLSALNRNQLHGVSETVASYLTPVLAY